MISVGGLRVGGSGKTPVVEHVARLLVENGERPAILTRGYGRRVSRAGVTVVSDGVDVRASVDDAGDEPLMLARALPGVCVLVAADRHAAGCFAERRLDATIHVLDDGFQHLALARDVDLLLVSENDLDDRPMPVGRLRENITAASAADALLVAAGDAAAAERIGRVLDVATVFRVARSTGAPRTIAADRHPFVVPPGSSVFLVTGIARPERFATDVAAAGWEVAGAMAFRDHHRFSQADVRRIAAAARTPASATVLTTEKDAIRLRELDLAGLPIASLPLVLAVEPSDRFRAWLLERIQKVRSFKAEGGSIERR